MRKLILILTFKGLTFVAHAQWQQTDGPESGFITCLAINGTNIFAGTYSEGVYYSANYGASWSLANTGLTNKYIKTILVNGNDIFAGTGNGIFLSTNNGANWTSVSVGLTDTVVYSLMLKGTDVFAGTNSGGVFLSTNNGASWSPLNSGSSPQGVRALVTNGTDIYAGANDGVYKSTDNGTSWVPAHLGIPQSSISSLAISGTNIFAANYFGVYLSTNNGDSWTFTGPGGVASTEFSTESLAVIGTDVFAGTGRVGLFKSSNNGSTWTAVTTGLTSNDIRALVSNGTDLFAGTYGGGVYVSTDIGTTWAPINNNLRSSFVNTMLSNGTTIFAGDAGSGLHLSADFGDSWIPSNNGITNYNITSLMMCGSNMFAGTYGGGAFISSDNGSGWTDINNGLSNTIVFSLASNGTEIFAGTWEGVFSSANNGVSWDSTGLMNNIVTDLMVSGTNIFAIASFSIQLSTDSGLTWSPIGVVGLQVLSLAVMGINIFAGTNEGVFLSTDTGATWIPLNNGMPNAKVNSLLVWGTNIFAGTEQGIFLSLDNGTSWIDISTGLPNLSVQSLLINGTDIYAGTIYGGVWKRSLTEIFNFFNFSGNVFNDVNNNSIKDLGETGLPNVFIKTKHDNWFYNSDSNGDYTAYSSVMNDTVEVISPSPYATVTPLNYAVTYQDTGKNFAVYYMPNINDLRITVTNLTPARPGFNDAILITYENVGTTTMNGNISLSFDNSNLTFISSSPIQAGINSNIINWNFTNLLPFESRNISVSFNLHNNVPLGTLLSFTAIVNPIAGDYTPANNTDTLSQIVTNSYDPNVKEVIPCYSMTLQQLADGEGLTYTIHFQNTGTDTAFYVKIIDYLSPELDVSTFDVLSSSHPCTFSLTDAGKVEFYFNNIMLPDSNIDLVRSNGFVKYFIKPISNLQSGDNIKNTAYIYFDFNLPIVTNTTNTIMVTNIAEKGAEENTLKIYPNPSQEYITIEFITKFKDAILSIYNVQGQIIMQQPVVKDKTDISISGLAKGLYIVKLNSNNRTVVTKFEKE